MAINPQTGMPIRAVSVNSTNGMVSVATNPTVTPSVTGINNDANPTAPQISPAQATREYCALGCELTCRCAYGRTGSGSPAPGGSGGGVAQPCTLVFTSLACW